MADWKTQLIVSILLLVIKTCHCQVRVPCDINYIGRLDHGIIQSFNYPFDYRNSLNCRYTIYFDPDEPSSGRSVCFKFHRFRLEYIDDCRNDYLSFEDETGLEMRYCGTGTVSSQSANANSMGNTQIQDRFNVFDDNFCWPATDSSLTVVLFSDARVNDTGFYAEFSVHRSRSQSVSQSVACTGFQFRCFNALCIDEMLRCNGNDDCGDNSDEDYTHARCTDAAEVIDISACDFEVVYPDLGQLICGFESVNWRQDVTSSLGPRADHTIGEITTGHFLYTMYLNTDHANFTYQAVPIERDVDHCFSLWYFMSAKTGTLKILMSNEKDKDLVVFTKAGNQGPDWRHAEIDVPKEAFPINELMIHATERTGDPFDPASSPIAIDDISFLPRKCIEDDLSCRFELGFCGWTNDPSGISWRRRKGQTPSTGTGPDSDASGDGYYSYIESSDASEGDIARLVSRSINHGHTGEKCFRFRFHMYGETVGTLAVAIIDSNGQEHIIWSRSENHFNHWMIGQVSLTEINGPFQLVLQATVGDGLKSDIAVDELELFNGYCSDIATPAPTGPTDPATCSPQLPFRCNSGHCISDWWICDGKFDCPDQSDEIGCKSSSLALSPGAVIGICCVGILIIVVIVVLVFYMKRRKHGPRNRAMNDAMIDNSSLYWPAYMSYPGAEGDEAADIDPPPPYMPENDLPEYSMSPPTSSMPPPYSTSAQPALTISIFPDDNAPPPAYNIAIYPRGRSSSGRTESDIGDSRNDSACNIHIAAAPSTSAAAGTREPVQGKTMRLKGLANDNNTRPRRSLRLFQRSRRNEAPDDLVRAVQRIREVQPRQQTGERQPQDNHNPERHRRRNHQDNTEHDAATNSCDTKSYGQAHIHQKARQRSNYVEGAGTSSQYQNYPRERNQQQMPNPRPNQTSELGNRSQQPSQTRPRSGQQATGQRGRHGTRPGPNGSDNPQRRERETVNPQMVPVRRPNSGNHYDMIDDDRHYEMPDDDRRETTI